MHCTICKNGETRPGTATVTLERGGSTIIIRDVPASVCGNCGEYYLSEDVTARVMEMAEEAVKRNAIIEILNYAA